MSQNSSFKDIENWLIILSILLLSSNVIFYVIFSQADPQQNSVIQIWKYFESETFRAITISLVIPIIMLFLENKFKIIENFNTRIEDEKKEREREHNEKIKKEKDDLSSSRNKTIEETRAFLEYVYSIISETASNEIVDKPTTDNQSTAFDLRNKLRSISPKGYNVVGKLYNQFPSISKEGHDRILFFLNVLIRLSTDIVIYLTNNKNERETLALRESLIVMLDSIQSYTFHSIIEILQTHKRLLELTHDKVEWKRIDDLKAQLPQDWIVTFQDTSSEENKENWKIIVPNMSSKDSEEITNLVKGIEGEKKYLDNLKEMWTEILRADGKKIYLLSKGENIEKFKTQYQKILESRKQHNGKKIRELKDFNNFKQSYDSLSFEDKFSLNPTYSLDAIKEFASKIGLSEIVYDMERKNTA